MREMRPLDRYTARNESFVAVVRSDGSRIAVLGARSAPKRHRLTSQGLDGISRARPWLVCLRAVPIAVIIAVAGWWPGPAAAQFRRAPESAIGEKYHIEGAVSWWNPDPSLIISSESLGIPGDDIDLVNDLGIEQKRLAELRLVLRPGEKHKFRINYIPIRYKAQSVVQREFVFNGQRYRVGVPVNTTADLPTYRFGYEYDFIYRPRGFVGFVVDLKYTDVQVRLDSPIQSEFTSQVAPIPTIGFTGRGYVVPNVAIGGEVTFFKIPKNLGGEDFGGRYVDYDFYGTFNFNNYVGAQLGFRSIDVEYFRDLDRGDLRFRGWYFGGVVRY